MNEWMRDFRIVHIGMILLQIVKMLNVVLTVGIIVFSALEAAKLLKNQTATRRKASVLLKK